MKYCHGLRLNGYSDWRLANMAELQGIYDKTVEAPGLAGPTKTPEAFTWHVKGNLFLTGDQWSGHQVTGRMPLESYEYHFDFNEGRPDKDPSGWPYPPRNACIVCARSRKINASIRSFQGSTGFCRSPGTVDVWFIVGKLCRQRP